MRPWDRRSAPADLPELSLGPDLDETIAERSGRRFLTAFYEALRIVKLHPIENRHVRDALAELTVATAACRSEGGAVELRIVRQTLFVNSAGVRIDVENFVSFDHVRSMLSRCGVGLLRIDGEPDAREWTSFLGRVLQFARPTHDPDRLHALRKALAARSVHNIVAEPPGFGDLDFTDEAERRQAAKNTYEQSVSVSREVFNGARLGRTARVRQVKHAVQGIVDQVLGNEASLGGLSTLKDYDDYAFTHAVNVCIFCVAIGRRLGLTKRQLYDLGLAALVHDVGMSRIPAHILTKDGALTPDEREQMQAHTWLGALSVFKLRDFGDIPFRGMIAAYEHHMSADGRGYPRPLRPRQPSIFSRIIAVASAFDAGTNTRAHAAARPPDAVLRGIWQNENETFDPIAVKALINVLGIYPVGTCVILDTFELGIVHAANSDASQVHRPIVRIISDADGAWLEETHLVDLADTDEGGTYRHSILKVTDAERYGLQVSDYLV